MNNIRIVEELATSSGVEVYPVKYVEWITVTNKKRCNATYLVILKT